MNKKGVIGLDTVRSFMIILLVLAVISIGVFLGLVAITSTDIVPNRAFTGGNFSNETIAFNHTGVAPATIVALGSDVTDVVYTGLLVNNNSDVVLSAANYSYTTKGLIYNLTSEFVGQSVNISVSGFTYGYPSRAVEVRNFTTGGILNFFAQIPTVFAVLAAAIIVMAILLILFAISRFSEGAGRPL